MVIYPADLFFSYINIINKFNIYKYIIFLEKKKKNKKTKNIINR